VGRRDNLAHYDHLIQDRHMNIHHHDQHICIHPHKDCWHKNQSMEVRRNWNFKIENVLQFNMIDACNLMSHVLHTFIWQRFP